MQAKRTFKVKNLTEEEASKLFCMKVGENTLRSDPSIPKLAEEMAKQCNRLPLALIVVGSAMAGVKSVKVWEHSIKNLTSSIMTTPDLEKKVFSVLKFSYDRLDEVLKHCFLYCALYSKDREILVLDLIDQWMWDNFLCQDMTKSVEDMRGHGESIIEKLELSCLLESVEDDIVMHCTIKMHDALRDMALCVAHNQDTVELVQGISIVKSWESRNNLDPPNVTTLILLKHVHSQRFLEGFICMQRLKILKLKVDEDFSVEIGGLVSLKYLSLDVNDEILGKEFLNNLRYFSLVSICQITIGSSLMMRLRMLRDKFPLGVLSSLYQLRVVRLIGRGINSLARRNLEELECLPNIEKLCIVIDDGDTLNKLMESTKLQSCIRQLTIRQGWIEMPLLLATMSRMKRLQQIEFIGTHIGSRQYSSVFYPCCLANLRSVVLSKCSTTHVTWLKYARLLQELEIHQCTSMEEVVKEEEKNVDSFVFCSIVTLYLESLPSLESIHKTPLHFSSLKSITIWDCPNLKKLPLNSNSAKQKLTLIKGEHDWWNNLMTWEDSAAKDIFHSKFRGY